MKAHFFKDGNRWRFSGYNACGDPFDGAGLRERQNMQARAFDAIVDIGRDFMLTSDTGDLYLTGPGNGRFSVFTPAAVLLAAKLCHFGFKLICGGKEYANG